MSPTIKPTTEITHRLSEEAYGQLTKGMPGIAVTNETTERQMGFQLGIQYVLQKLREGFVIGRA